MLALVLICMGIPYSGGMLEEKVDRIEINTIYYSVNGKLESGLSQFIFWEVCNCGRCNGFKVIDFVVRRNTESRPVLNHKTGLYELYLSPSYSDSKIRKIKSRSFIERNGLWRSDDITGDYEMRDRHFHPMVKRKGLLNNPTSILDFRK